MRSLLALSHTGGLGGAELGLLELLLALRGAGWDSRCVVPSVGELATALDGHGVPASVVPFQRWATPRSSAAAVARGSQQHLGAVPRTALAVPRIIRILRRHRPGLVLTNTITNPVGALAARAVGIPHVTFAHEFGVDDHGLRFFLGFERSLRLLSRQSAAFLANSQATADYFAGKLSRPVPMVPYTMTLAKRRLDPLGPRGDCLRALVLGRVTDGKNQLAAVRAVGQARAGGTPVKLRLVGTGEAGCLARVLAEVDALGLAGHVHHQAHVADPAVEIDAAQVLVVPSRREAFGRVTVEAMLRSRPVIAAARGASPELVQSGRSGLLYDPDDPEALAGALATAWRGWDDVRRWSTEAYASATATFGDARTITAFEAAVAHRRGTRRADAR